MRTVGSITAKARIVARTDREMTVEADLLDAQGVTVAKATATYTKAVVPWQKKTVGVLDERLLLFRRQGLAHRPWRQHRHVHPVLLELTPQ